MGKKVCVVIGSLISVFILIEIVNIVFIKISNKPLIYLSSSKGENIVYYSLLYNVYDCELNSNLVIKSKSSKYECPIKYEFSITDETKFINDFACDEALEEIYKDENYSYNLTCLKSKYIKVNYIDGSVENIKDALFNKNITIDKLDEYNIDYVKVPLASDEVTIPDVNISDNEVIDESINSNQNEITNKEQETIEIPINENTKERVIKIIDKSGPNCAQAIEYFYQNYYFTCQKSNYVYVDIDGNVYLLKDALNNKIITIEELEKAGYKFNKDKNFSKY